MEPRTLARHAAHARLAFGVVLLYAPGFVARRWVDEDGTGTEVVAACLGGRDLVLGAGLLRGLASGGAQTWLQALALADLGDLLVTVRARRELRTSAVVATVVVAGASAAFSAWLSAQGDW